MDSVEPVMHSNKRFRQTQDVGIPVSTYHSSAAPQTYPGPGCLSNQRTSSDQSSGSDQGQAGSMSRSVSDSSLALSGPDTRSSGGNMTSSYPQYANSDIQNQHMLVPAHSASSLQNGAMQPNPNVVPFQENPSTTNRGHPPAHLSPAFLVHASQMQPMNGCLPPSGGSMSHAAMSNGPLSHVLINNAPQANGPMNHGSTLPQASGTSAYGGHPNGLISAMPPSQGFPPGVPVQGGPYRGPESAPQPSMASTVPAVPTPAASSAVGSSALVTLEPPCAACKSLRRKCTRDCIFLPYFPRDDPEKFARVHKVFGASNVAKMLQDLPVHQREDTVASLEYEAQARVQDPVFGCVGILCLLQKQIAMLQNQVAELQRHQGGAAQDGVTSLGSTLQPSLQTAMPGGSVITPHS